MKTFLDSLASEHHVHSEHHAARLAVWEALKTNYPALAGQISLLFAEDADAARWLCARHRNGPSVADRIAAGRITDVEEMLVRALHGMSA